MSFDGITLIVVVNLIAQFDYSFGPGFEFSRAMEIVGITKLWKIG